MTPEAAHLDALFVRRTSHRRLLIGSEDAASGSRVGGRPPAPLAEAPPRCPLCGGPLRYVLTLSSDTLGYAIAGDRDISLLACPDYGCLCKSHRLIEPSSTVLVVHPAAPRALAASEIDSACEGRRLTLGEIAPDSMHPNGFVWTDATKLGGGPGYLSGWGPEEGQKVEPRGGAFLFQWSESSLAENGIKSGQCVFSWGVVYVFCGVNPGTGLPALAEPAAFWQNT